jgi:hypothetical protein
VSKRKNGCKTCPYRRGKSSGGKKACCDLQGGTIVEVQDSACELRLRKSQEIMKKAIACRGKPEHVLAIDLAA